MKRIFTILSAGILALLAVSCVKEELAIFDASKVTAPVLGTYDIGEDAITVKYTPAVFDWGYNEKIAPSHTLAIVSFNGEEVSKTLTTSDKDNTLTLKSANLVKALITLGAAEGSNAKVELAVRATMQDPSKDNGENGHADSEAHVVVNNFAVIIPEVVGSPYEDYTETSAWGVTGSIAAYEISWDKDLCMWATEDGNKHVAAHVTLKAGDEIKFRKDAAWAENYGGDLGSIGEEFSVSQDGPNIKIAADGLYDIFLDLGAGTALLAEAYDPIPDYTESSNWSVIGALSKLGINWDGDVAMVSDGSNHVALSVSLAADDQFKFRQDASWSVNLGGDFAGLDTDFSVTQDGPNISVGAEGVYDLYVNPGAGTAKVTAASGLKISVVPGSGDPGTPEEPVKLTGWNIIGLNGDWENDVAASANGNVWTAFITAENDTEFKWRKDADWAENYGGVMEAYGQPFAAVAGGDNIKVAAGFYKVVLDLTNAEAPTITVFDEFTVWSLIGVNGDWNNDIDMAEVDGKWVSPATKIGGEFKIRKNHGWDDNRGGVMVAVGEPFAAVAGGDNIKVEEAEYIVTYDPSAETITVDTALPSNVWSLIGVNGDWNNDIFMTELMPGVWVSPEVEITAAGWKVRYNHGWDVNRGGATPEAEGVFVRAVPGGDNINLTGKFKVVYNANNETIGTLVWGVVGSIASIDGFNWNNDVPMNLASDGKWYSIPVSLASGDMIKIRKYAAWDENFGGSFVEAEAPFEAVAGGDNIAAEGNFIVIYDPAAGTLELCQEFWGIIGGFSNWLSDRFMLYNGTAWVAYGQNFEGEWKLRQGADWNVNRGGTLEAVGTPFAVTNGGPNITFPAQDDHDIYYSPAEDMIYVMAAGQVPEISAGGGSSKPLSITIDGKGTEWTGSDDILSLTCADGAPMTGLKSVKAYYSDKLYFLMEFSDEALAKGVADGKLRMHIFFNSNNTSDDGLKREFWDDACIDYMTEGKATSGGAYINYGAKLYKWAGDTPTAWSWDTANSIAVTWECAGEGNFYELSMDYSTFPGLADEITVAFDIADGSYNVIGYLPNVAEGGCTTAALKKVK